MILNEEDFARALVVDGHCSSMDEAVVLAEVVLSDFNTDTPESDNNNAPTMINLLQDYLGLEELQALQLTTKLMCQDEDISSTDDSDDASDNDRSSQPISDELLIEEEEDDDALFDGECEMCDRYIRLTKHHLIPKSTWSRLESRLRNAAIAKAKGDVDRATMLLGEGLEHVLERLEADRSCIRAILRSTCDICRPCHTAVHQTHDNMMLALSYSTVDQLLKDERIAKFCKWANKQRPGKHAVS